MKFANIIKGLSEGRKYRLPDWRGQFSHIALQDGVIHYYDQSNMPGIYTIHRSAIHIDNLLSDEWIEVIPPVDLFNFKEALNRLDDGKKCRCTNWRKNSYVVKQDDQYLWFDGKKDKLLWTPLASDLTNETWHEV